eukprot:Tamp_20869.p1 GENE.Tamp_20869~~Tamp_20869.p1  ORF type:complete len:187 (+),score=13.63 Tamp_20869:3-563(+)
MVARQAGLEGGKGGEEGGVEKCLVVVISRQNEGASRIVGSDSLTGARKSRAVANQNEFVRAVELGLPRCQIAIHYPSMSFDQQLELVSQALAFIGPHGAAMTQMVVAPAQTLIVDFLVRKAEDINICYLILALKLNMRYFGRVSPGAKGAWEPMILTAYFIEEVVTLLQTHLEGWGRTTPQPRQEL